MMTFKQMIHDCRANSDTKQPQLLSSDLLTQILYVLVEIRDNLTAQQPKNEFWPMDEGGESDENSPTPHHI
jgi:hypothetical protein